MSKILKGIDQIRKYINSEDPPGRDKITELIKVGMPAWLFGGTWYAHADNIDRFFMQQTSLRYNKAPDEIIKKGR